MAGLRSFSRPTANAAPLVDRHEDGAAMLEFVLALPFIWIILMLTINFGHGFLERHRSIVAARELALRHSQEVADGTENMAALIARLEQDTLELRGLKAIMSGPDDGGCSGEGGARDARRVSESFNEGGSSSAGKKISDFLGRLSMTQVYSLQAEGPEVGGLLPAATHSACFAIDGHTWTYHETGGAAGLLKSLVTGVLGNLF